MFKIVSLSQSFVDAEKSPQNFMFIFALDLTAQRDPLE